MAIRKIETAIQEFSVIPQINTTTFPEDIDIYNSEQPQRIVDTNAVILEMNDMAFDMNAIAVIIDGYSTSTKTYRDEALSARNDAIEARDEIQGYVIPAEATYNPETIDAKNQTQNLEDFLGFNF